MKKYYRDSVLAKKLIVGTVLCSSIITLLLTSFHLYTQYARDIDQLSQSEKIIQNSLLNSLSESVWDYDNKLIQLQLEGVLSQPYIEQTYLELKDGQTFHSGSLEHDWTKTYVFPIIHEQKGKRRELGTLTVTADLHSIYQQLINSAALTLLFNAIKTFGVVMFMLFLIERLIGRHLLRIVSSLDKIDPEQSLTSIELGRPTKHLPDDMDKLAEAINAMQQRIHDAHHARLIASQEKAELQEKIINQNQQLAQLDRVFTMGEMATSLAHELNQPLASITGFADICKRLVSQDKINHEMVEKTLEKVSSEAIRASEIIRRTREFVRDRTPQRGCYNICPLVLESIAMLQDMASKNQVQVSYQPITESAQIEVDKVQLEQVLINLIRNAIEALSQQTDGHIIISQEVKENMALLHIADNGPGLADKVMQNLFKPFISTKESGMGVGLSICHSIIEAHGGQITVTSKPYQGACFTIQLPTSQNKEISL
ncbi:ATP-binding protein [Motilimonas sp. E26]|uniref:sensor histidine kinase n=1 Tax=Motilimonas sp. E26 TaxID=2865674 RepID=UPI001E5445BB|nr:ATP-binding protein [Motilimonas sp. E26]MCE0557203.1 GHKL domain-containing protein [Motilimonas sp. E26]